MTKQPVSQLRFKPGALGWHDAPRIRDRQQILHPRGIQRKRTRPHTTLHQPLQFAHTSDPSHKLDPLARARVMDPKPWRKNQSLQQRGIQRLHQIPLPSAHPGTSADTTDPSKKT
jgi:hypothetical protein